MLVTPATQLPVGDWVYELKWDGMRALVQVDGHQVKVTSRRGREHTDTFSELAGLTDLLAERQVLLDGEIVCTEPDGRPSFERLGVRLANAKRPQFWIHRLPATFVACDLRLDGTDLMRQPWEQRRAALVALGLDLHTGPWRVNAAYDDGAELLAVTGQMGLEGVVAKHRRSGYRPGIRTRWWLKCKHLQRRWTVIPRELPRHGLRS
jgi:bifunctional non-homologous end joining protein LigD